MGMFVVVFDCLLEIVIKQLMQAGCSHIRGNLSAACYSLLEITNTVELLNVKQAIPFNEQAKVVYCQHQEYQENRYDRQPNLHCLPSGVSGRHR